MSSTFEYVYEFNASRVDGNGKMKDLLGGKGAGLSEMCRAGLPVPPGFTITTEACKLFSQDRSRFDSEVLPEIDEATERLEEVAGRKLGSESNPLLVSVRSGAKFSMPGMMDTVLNLGLNDGVVEGLFRLSENEAFSFDCYRRLLQMFGEVVLGISDHLFEEVLTSKRSESGVQHDFELDGAVFRQICGEFKGIVERQSGLFPQDPHRQIHLAIEAVFKSWNNPRAITYRRINEISDDLGTGVNVQMMVFGNRGDLSGSGVGFTRDPATGERCLYGEFLPKSQGEEVVAGTRTPLAFSQLEKLFPENYQQLKEIAINLEKHYREMQDFEFTIEEGTLFFLQTRDGKRTGQSAVQIASDLYKEGVISKEEAILRVDPEQLNQLLHPVFKNTDAQVLATGLPASPGAAVGRAVFSANEAVTWHHRGDQVILIRRETTPDDIHGMEVAEGILTSRGGMTSHAAVVCRGMGKCGVVGCEDLDVDEKNREFRAAGVIVKEGDYISVDGNDGRVILGRVDKVEVEPESGLLRGFMDLLEGLPSMAVRANADTGRDAGVARQFGAVGIGLCRTEHMFFGEDRLSLMQEMLLAQSSEERISVLSKLKEFQRLDFREIFEVMDGLPVTVRLLDPPLHEFLPKQEELKERLEQLQGQSDAEEEIQLTKRLLRRGEELSEFNPMMGHRGCRLGITYPEITTMQAEAIFEAACELKQEGKNPVVEVMVPLVSLSQEFANQSMIIREAAERVLEQRGVDVSYLVGTMIELPRAALVAGQIAEISEFFSFGTNDLTQTAFGFSRDDAAPFIKLYEEQGILEKDPFQTLDQTGVGELVEMAVERGRKTRPSLKLGICGEHGGDPESVRFCCRIGLDYVSCSPFRVPVARLAAAQASIDTSAVASIPVLK